MAISWGVYNFNEVASCPPAETLIVNDYSVYHEADAPLKCSLATCSIRNRQGGYFSLSYSWGDLADTEATELAWRKALFEAVTHNGAEYLNRIDLIKKDQIPTWALAVSFLLMAGINVGGGYTAVKRIKDPIWIKNCLISLGPAGVTAGGNFLIRLLGSKAPDVEVLKAMYDEVMEHLMDAIESVIERIQNFRSKSRNKDAMTDRCGQIASGCYAIAASAVKAMVANEDVCRAYVMLRNKAALEIANSSAGFLGSLTQATLAVGTVQAKMSAGQAALSYYVGLAKVPTVITITNPSLFGAALVGLAMTGYVAYEAHGRKCDFERKIQWHRDINILISRAWSTSDDIARYVEWMHCLGPNVVNANFLRRLGDEHGAQRFEDFMEPTSKECREDDKDKTKTVTKTKTKGKTKPRSQGKRTEKKRKIRAPHIIRLIRLFTKEQAQVLSDTLRQLKEDGALGLPPPDPLPPDSPTPDSDTETSDSNVADD